MAPFLTPNKDIILFDGVCVFCNNYINYIIAHDPGAHFVFAHLQSDAAKDIASVRQLDFESTDSVFVIAGQQVYSPATAILYIADRLNLPWYSKAKLLRLALPFARNYIYSVFAAGR